MAKISALRKIFQKSVEPTPSEQRNYFESAGMDHVEKILLLSETETVLRIIPDTRMRRIGVIRSIRHQYLAQKLTAPQALSHIDFIYNAGPKQVRSFTAGGRPVLCERDNPPLKRDHFDILVCPLALEQHSDWQRIVERASASLKNGGRIIVSVCHPQFEQNREAPGTKKVGYTENSITGYFNELKKHKLFTEELLEGRIDATHKPYFVDENMSDHYPAHKNLPVTLVLRAVKFVKQTRHL